MELVVLCSVDPRRAEEALSASSFFPEGGTLAGPDGEHFVPLY
jgi:hypothetical protein